MMAHGNFHEFLMTQPASARRRTALERKLEAMPRDVEKVMVNSACELLVVSESPTFLDALSHPRNRS
jgi:hypothetical protein